MKKPNIEMITVPASKLRVHPTAQRKLVPGFAKRLKDELDLDGLGTIAVVRYRIDGELVYWIVDGQHRWWAIMQNGLGDWEMHCVFYKDVKDNAAASELFLKLNAKANVTAFDKYVNEVRAGDAAAMGIEQIVHANGLRVARFTADGTIASVAALKQVYAIDQGTALRTTLETAIECWGRTAPAVDGKMVVGLGRLFSTYNGEIERPALLKKLKKFPGGASGILGRAKAKHDMREGSVPACVQAVIVGEYNRGRRAKKLS